jgi:hypothetical protein
MDKIREVFPDTKVKCCPVDNCSFNAADKQVHGPVFKAFANCSSRGYFLKNSSVGAN